MVSDLKTFLTEREAAEFLALAPRTLRQWRWRGVGPRYAKFGRAVRYRYEELKAWADAQGRVTAGQHNGEGGR